MDRSKYTKKLYWSGSFIRIAARVQMQSSIVMLGLLQVTLLRAKRGGPAFSDMPCNRTNFSKI